MPGQDPAAKYFRLVLVCTVIAFGLVLFSLYTRMADANPGCSAWSGCYGKPFAPLTAREIYEARRDSVPPADAQRAKAWRDALCRYLSGIFGLALMGLAYRGRQLARPRRSSQFVLPAVAAVFALLQTGLGLAAGRIPGPFSALVGLAAGVTVLALLWWVALREQRIWKSVPDHPRIRHLRVRAVVALALVAGVVLLGGWTAANNAGLACPDFPTCQGGWWPVMDFADGFMLWRSPGLAHLGGMLDLAGITAIDVAHRVAALIVLLYVGWLALRTMRVGYDSNLCRYGMLVLVLLLGETVAGVMDIVLRMPLMVAVVHGAAGVLLLLSLVTLNHVLRPQRHRAETRIR
ncbi:MAG: COX15/CtaA family protein [Pseudomonadota bacterium]|nr:COX15/CtaA family protein [Pseudomonadota bacterium]